MKYFEADFEDGYSVACRGLRIPTIAEANEFCTRDFKECGQVVEVLEIDFEEVKLFFDTDNFDNWPIFGE